MPNHIEMADLLLKIPLFGREEDAADQFSAYIMLHFGKEDAHRLIEGAAYQYWAASGCFLVRTLFLLARRLNRSHSRLSYGI